jgi:hypothetical protein
MQTIIFWFGYADYSSVRFNFYCCKEINVKLMFRTAYSDYSSVRHKSHRCKKIDELDRVPIIPASGTNSIVARTSGREPFLAQRECVRSSVAFDPAAQHNFDHSTPVFILVLPDQCAAGADH